MSLSQIALCAILCFALVECQRGFHVKIENLSPGAIVPSAFGDLVWAVHAGANPLFRPGSYASAGLQRAAEDGQGATLLAEANNATDAASNTVGLVSGPLPAGSTWQFGITASPGQRFSFVTMYGASNDVFLAPTSGGLPLFDSNGNPSAGIFDVILYDAGTERNEALGQGVNQAPTQPRAAVGQVTQVPVSRLDIRGTNYSDASAIVRFTLIPATMFRMRLDNNGNQTGFSPPVWAVSTDIGAIFTSGQKASAGVQGLAEDGKWVPLAAELAAKRSVIFSGFASTSPVKPGQFVEWVVPSALGTRFFLASMYGASNDRFFSTPSAGVSLFDSNGPISTSSANFINLWDAGTAMNEQPGQGKYQAAARHGQPRNPAVWPDEVGVVKDALLGDPDTFTYETGGFTLSISPITDASGFQASNPNQNLYVNFKFQNMFKLT